MEKMTVSLDDYLRYLLKKWKIILAFLVLFVLLFCASAKMLGEKIVIPTSEEYLDLKEQEASISKYIENAPLMEIDSTCVQEIILYLSDISDKKVLKNYIDSGDVWKEFGEEDAMYYFPDIVTWTDVTEGISAEIKIQHYEEEKCALMAEYLIKKIQSFDEKAEVFSGTQHVSSDTVIADVQSWYKNRMSAIKGQLEYARAGYTIETNLPIAAVTGALMGGFVSIVALFFTFLLNKKS